MSKITTILKIAVIPVTITLMALAYGAFKRKAHQPVAQKAAVAQVVTKHKKSEKKAHNTVTPSDVILDFNGVMFEINKHKAGSVLGIGNVLSYALSGHSPKNLENIMFDVLNKLDEQLHLPAPTTLVMHKDRPLPRVMTSWMRGDISGCDLITKLNDVVDQLDQEEFFASDKEKVLIKRLGCVFFDPCTRVKLYQPIKKTIKLLKKLKGLGHRVFMLTNIDNELITLLKQEYPEIFELIDGIVTSAEAKMVKPDANIYKHIERKFDIKKAVLLDDEPANCSGATRADANITGIVYNPQEMGKKELRAVNQELVMNNILPAGKRAVQMA